MALRHFRVFSQRGKRRGHPTRRGHWRPGDLQIVLDLGRHWQKLGSPLFITARIHPAALLNHGHFSPSTTHSSIQTLPPGNACRHSESGFCQIQQAPTALGNPDSLDPSPEGLKVWKSTGSQVPHGWWDCVPLIPRTEEKPKSPVACLDIKRRIKPSVLVHSRLFQAFNFLSSYIHQRYSPPSRFQDAR